MYESKISKTHENEFDKQLNKIKEININIKNNFDDLNQK